MTRMACYLTSPAIEEQVRTVILAEAPDLIVVDAMFPAALAQAIGFAGPSALFVHTFVFRQIDMWRGMIARLDGFRRQAGYGSLPPLDDLWRARDLIVSTSLAAFDAPPIAGWEKVRHVGPVLEDERCAVPAVLPWADGDPTPLALVSFSTGFEQRNVEKVQRALDALADAPVHVVATTGGVVAPHELAAPANAVVFNYAAHDPIMRRAALIVTHGGHGTAMRALKHGVPLVVVPGLAGDQPYVAAAVQEYGAGCALPGDAGVEAMREAALDVLANASYRDEARRRARALAGVDGAEGSPPTRSKACGRARAARRWRRNKPQRRRLPTHTGEPGLCSRRASRPKVVHFWDPFCRLREKVARSAG